MIIVFDLDGTLADCRHRRYHVENNPKNWKRFFDEMVMDPIVPSLAQLLYSLQNPSNRILICTGRPEAYRRVTEEWLHSFNVCHFKMYMRKDNDYRADNIIKKELLDAMTAEGHRPDLSIDDRESVVSMWRENGIPCLQYQFEATI